MNWRGDKLILAGLQALVAGGAVIMAASAPGATAESAAPHLVKTQVADLQSTMAQHAASTTTETETFQYDLKHPHGLTLLYNGCRGSRIEPCGCRALNLGGIDKEAAIVQTIRQANPATLTMDAGGFFREFTDPSMRLQTWYMLEALSKLKVGAINIGFPDMRQGMATLKYFESRFSLPFMSANIVDTDTGKPLFAPYKEFEINAGGDTIKVAVVGVTAPSRDSSRGTPEGSTGASAGQTIGSPTAGRWMIAETNGSIPWLPFDVHGHAGAGGASPMPGPGGSLSLPVKFAVKSGEGITSATVSPYRVENPEQTAAQWGQQLKPDHDVMVLLAYTTIEKAVEMAAQLTDYDVIVAADYVERMEPIRPVPNGPLVICSDHDGKYVGIVEIAANSIKGDISEGIIADQIPVLQSIEPLPEYRHYIDEFAAQTANLPIEEASTQIAEKIYAGVTSCKTCHVDAYKQWKTHKHSHAMKTLVDKNMHYNPDCLKCHTVAYRMPGGFTDLRVTANLANVQCEVCHGPGESHVKQMRAAEQLKREGKTVPPPDLSDMKMTWDANFCMQCHDPQNDPHFSFPQDIKRVRHKNTAAQRERPTTVSLDMM